MSQRQDPRPENMGRPRVIPRSRFESPEGLEPADRSLEGYCPMCRAKVPVYKIDDVLYCVNPAATHGIEVQALYHSPEEMEALLPRKKKGAST